MYPPMPFETSFFTLNDEQGIFLHKAFTNSRLHLLIFTIISPYPTLQATDKDIGLNGEVRYALNQPRINPPPFDIDEVEGLLTTTAEFLDPDKTQKTLPYRLRVVAHDRSVLEPFQSTETDCYVSVKK